MKKLEITHITRYSYTDMAQDSVNEIRLTPLTDNRQSCYHHSITTEPVSAFFTYSDYFHNRVHAFTVNKIHRELTIIMSSTVVTHDNDNIPSAALSPYEEKALGSVMISKMTMQNTYCLQAIQGSQTKSRPIRMPLMISTFRYMTC